MPFAAHLQKNAIYTSARAFRRIRAYERVAMCMRSPVVEIVAFDRKFDRSSFSCGKPDLDDWLKRQAGQQERANNTRTFLAVRGQQIIGYYATTTYRLGLDEAAAMFGVGRRAYPIPAVLLARLAVDSSCQGSGVGSKMLFHALMQIAAASRYVGFEVVVVHAIDSDAVTFYAQRGFTQFEDHELHLFMPVKNLLATLEA
jgi:predicted N-acetyltransferase YhbS